MVIIQFRYLYLLAIRPNNVTTSLRRHYPTSLWSCHIVAVETSDDVAKTTPLQRLIMTPLYETLQQRRLRRPTFPSELYGDVRARWKATSQQRCNDVQVSTGIYGDIQKQPSRGVFKKRYSENMQHFHRRTPMPKYGFNIKLLCNVIEITLWHGCSPVNLLHIFSSAFL